MLIGILFFRKGVISYGSMPLVLPLRTTYEGSIPLVYRNSFTKILSSGWVCTYVRTLPKGTTTTYVTYSILREESGITTTSRGYICH